MGKETISRTTFVKGVTAGVIAAASLGILTVGEYAIDVNTSGESASSAVSSESTAADTGSAGTVAADLSACTPGTYTASAKGISSDVTVTVTIDETGITDISADVSGETPDIGGVIGDEMIEKVLSAQSAAVDGVAGATITSDAFKAAVADCIAQASGGGASDEADAASDEDASEAATENIEAEDTESDIASEDESETESTDKTAAPSDDTEADPAGTSASSLTPGTYTASAAGISSDITVTVTIDETGITDITADVSGETAGLGADIGDEMIEKALSAQSADIDGVSGVTITSDAFKAAVADCIAQASGDGAGEAAPQNETVQEPESDTASEDESETESTDETAVGDESEEETAAEIDSEEETAAEAESEQETAAETDTADASADVSEADTAGQEFIPGAYVASAAGISSDVKVVAVFDESGITSLYTDVSGETPDIGGVIGDEMIEKALDAQSADIDGVSGATITSDAFKSALSSCISMASGEASIKEAAAETDTVEASAEAAETDTADQGFVPGAYSASAAGISSDVEVVAVFDETGITSLFTDVSGETPEIGGVIGDEMIEKALDAQSADIDGVSGATITSDAFKSALSSCITMASSGGSVGMAETELDESDIEAVADVDGSDGPTSTFVAGKDTFVPGTYTATAAGIDSDVTVTVTFDETSIVDIEVDVSGETAGIGAIIGDDITAQILTAQSADVDGVAGATITSDAVKTATADCISQAKAGTGSEAESEAETEAN